MKTNAELMLWTAVFALERQRMIDGFRRSHAGMKDKYRREYLDGLVEAAEEAEAALEDLSAMKADIEQRLRAMPGGKGLAKKRLFLLDDKEDNL